MNHREDPRFDRAASQVLNSCAHARFTIDQLRDAAVSHELLTPELIDESKRHAVLCLLAVRVLELYAERSRRRLSPAAKRAHKRARITLSRMYHAA